MKKSEAQKQYEKYVRDFNKKHKPKKSESEIRAQKVLKDAARRMKMRSDAYDKKHDIE